MIPSSQNALADAMGSSPFNKPSERTVIDKLFAREDVERIRELSKKKEMTEEEWQELLHLMTAVEPKLLNLEPELMYKLSQFIVGVAGFMTESGAYATASKKLKERKESGGIVSQRSIALFNEARARMDKSTKMIHSIFSYSGRVTLSNKAMAFKEFTRAQWEYFYPQQQQQSTVPLRDYFNKGGNMSG